MLLVLTMLAVPVSADISGPVRVIDGDTIAIDGARLRLQGIDAVERGQRCGVRGVGVWDCGAWVSDQVAARFDGRRAACEVLDRDRYERDVVRCSVAGEDLGRWIVAEGLAVAYRKYSTAYVADETAAKQAKRGLHNVDFIVPEAYRKAERVLKARVSAPAPVGCAIKGNVSYNGGTRIYHLPGQAFYSRTVISTERGERWFCSEAAARQAGWRKALR